MSFSVASQMDMNPTAPIGSSLMSSWRRGRLEVQIGAIPNSQFEGTLVPLNLVKSVFRFGFGFMPAGAHKQHVKMSLISRFVPES